MKRLILLLTLILYSVNGVCREEIRVDLGGGTDVSVPVPNGFEALGSQSPEFRKNLEATVPPVNVLIEIFLPKEEMSDILSGRSHLNRELKIVSLRSTFGHDISNDAFERGVAFMRASKDSIVKSQEEMNKFASLRLDHFGGSAPQASGPVNLGLFLNDPNAIGSTVCMVVTNNTGPDKRCIAQVFLWVDRRAVLLDVAATIDSEADIAWVVDTAKSWGYAILSANP